MSTLTCSVGKLVRGIRIASTVVFVCWVVLFLTGCGNASVTRQQASGNLIWAVRAGGSKDDEGRAIARLSDDSVVVTGIFRDSATFGLGELNEAELVSEGYPDIFIGRYNADGALAWVKRAGGAGDDYADGITALSDDSAIMTGSLGSRAATFGEGEPNEALLSSGGFIARYSRDGTLRWAKSTGAGAKCKGISSLSDDSVVVIGYFDSDKTTLGEGESNETVLSLAGWHGEPDFFIARYNPDGTLAWAKRGGGSGAEYPEGVTTLSDNSVAVIGWFFGSATLGEGEPNETVVSSTDVNFDSDIFIARYYPDGTLAWAKRAGHSGENAGEVGREIIALSDDRIIVTGDFCGPATFGEGELNEAILTSPHVLATFMAQLNTDGTLTWAKAHSHQCYVITALSDDSIVATGPLWDSVAFGRDEPNETILTCLGVHDIAIARYNRDGALVWAKKAGGTSPDLVRAITRLSDNSTVVTGDFGNEYSGDSAIFGPGEPNETVLLSSASSGDIFIARFAP